MKKTGRFFQGSGRIGDGGAEGEGQGGEIAQHIEIFGKRVGMELSCCIGKKLEKQQGTHRCGVDAL
ncbi:MAG: hypothetical protein II462_03625 [Muribaculaceae bacterium]|nr:hypothetical protein [Muribaculaceae bacterium]